LACALLACATRSGGSAPAAPPPRLSAPAEEPPGITARLSLCGLVVVGNVGELHFRLELAGERVGVRHGQSGDTYLVDGMTVEVTTVLADEIAPTARTRSGVDLLRMHATWESARRSQSVGGNVEPEEVGIFSSDGMPTGLAWWFPGVGTEAGEGKSGETAPDSAAAPADRAAAEAPRPTGLAFMTAAYGHRVVVLAVQGSHGEPKSALVAKAEAWMATVTTSPRSISTRQVAAETKAAVAAGQTCPGRPNAVLEE
jgi:hypothetical protein